MNIPTITGKPQLFRSISSEKETNFPETDLSSKTTGVFSSRSESLSELAGSPSDSFSLITDRESLDTSSLKNPLNGSSRNSSITTIESTYSEEDIQPSITNNTTSLLNRRRKSSNLTLSEEPKNKEPEEKNADSDPISEKIDEINRKGTFTSKNGEKLSLNRLGNGAFNFVYALKENSTNPSSPLIIGESNDKLVIKVAKKAKSPETIQKELKCAIAQYNDMHTLLTHKRTIEKEDLPIAKIYTPEHAEDHVGLFSERVNTSLELAFEPDFSIKTLSKLDTPSFNTHQAYYLNIYQKISDKSFEELSPEEKGFCVLILDQLFPKLSPELQKYYKKIEETVFHSFIEKLTPEQKEDYETYLELLLCNDLMKDLGKSELDLKPDNFGSRLQNGKRVLLDFVNQFLSDDSWEDRSKKIVKNNEFIRVFLENRIDLTGNTQTLDLFKETHPGWNLLDINSGPLTRRVEFLEKQIDILEKKIQDQEENQMQHIRSSAIGPICKKHKNGYMKELVTQLKNHKRLLEKIKPNPSLNALTPLL